VHYPIIIVIDDDEYPVGVLTLADYNKYMWEQGLNSLEGKILGDICAKNFKFVKDGEDIYSQARNVFSDTRIASSLPIISKTGGGGNRTDRQMADFLPRLVRPRKAS
jgi:hypothetical protein